MTEEETASLKKYEAMIARVPDVYLAYAFDAELMFPESPLRDLIVAEMKRRIEYGVEIKV